MNSLIQKLTNANNWIQIKDLEVNKKYNIKKFKKLQTKYGLRTLMELDYNNDIISVFLPIRFDDRITINDVDNYKG